MSSTRVRKVRPFPIGDRDDEIADDPDPSQYISCRCHAGCCCNGNAVVQPCLAVGGGRSSTTRRTSKRRWLLSLQDRRLPGDRDLGWIWAGYGEAGPCYEGF